MHRPTAALGVALSLAWLGVARADDAKPDWKWDATKKSVPAVGARSFEEGDEARREKVKVTMGGQTMPAKDEDVSVAFRLTRETLAVEKDKVTKSRVKVERWKLTTKGSEEVDASLEGKSIVVTGTGAERAYEIEDDKDGTVTPAARHWIEANVSKKDRKKAKKAEGAEPAAAADEESDRLAALLPKEPVADGAEWTRDAEALAGTLLPGATIDAQKSSVKGKLSKVRVEDGIHVGHIEITVSVQVKSLPTQMGAALELKDGGLVEMTVTLDGSLEPEKRESVKMEVAFKFKAKGEVDTPQGPASFSLNTSLKQSQNMGALESKKASD